MNRRSYKLPGVGLLVAATILITWQTAIRAAAQPADPGNVVTQYYAALKKGDLPQALRFVWEGSSPEPVVHVLEMLRTPSLFGPPPIPPVTAGLIQCRSNLRNIGIALEMYATDHSGRFPGNLSKIAPSYLAKIPTCPSAKRDTYTATYESTAVPAAYTVSCGGANHKESQLAAGFPRYTSNRGLEVPETMEATTPRPPWTLESAKVLEQKVQGDRASVRVEEVYALYGYPVRLLVDMPLRRDGDTWKIDSASMSGDELLAAIKEAAAAPSSPTWGGPGPAWAPVGQWLTTHGLGWSVAALAGGPKMEGFKTFLEEQTRRQALTGCRNNLKNIGTALEMYSTDNSGRFATTLSQLTPNYLRSIPTCPAAGTDTYSASFKSASLPDAYTVMCTGTHHARSGMPANHPRYTSTEGLIAPETKEPQKP